MTGAPNLFLLAAPRAGSTQVFTWLDSHPDVWTPGVKEPNHYSARDFPATYVAASHLNDIDPARFLSRPSPPRVQFAVFRDPGQYAALYGPASAPWALDASTSYLASPSAVAALAAAHPGARAITLTRDPLGRALSHFRLARRTGRATGSLEDELALERSGALPPGACYLLRPSLQDDKVALVARLFGPRHLALRFEDLSSDPAAMLARIAAFLDIDETLFDRTRLARNAGVAPRFPALNTWLFQSGLKTRLRRSLPRRAKPVLRRMMFHDHPGPIHEAEVALLRRALGDAQRRCAA
ncbi:sulfotransferase [Anianabacter salinae]|uniref:sulfotransferase n=1 Tax=Anianabacter salinae TaxID=2851023 RepID=UPI00225E2370|nr:sulfotransferase [Anianabacter salinae]MBV0911121.1 sulfotransferase [Anianabacter salinae]